jgi:hypothetical protein
MNKLIFLTWTMVNFFENMPSTCLNLSFFLPKKSELERCSKSTPSQREVIGHHPDINKFIILTWTKTIFNENMSPTWPKLSFFRPKKSKLKRCSKLIPSQRVVIGRHTVMNKMIILTRDNTDFYEKYMQIWLKFSFFRPKNLKSKWRNKSILFQREVFGHDADMDKIIFLTWSGTNFYEKYLQIWLKLSFFRPKKPKLKRCNKSIPFQREVIGRDADMDKIIFLTCSGTKFYGK